MVRRVVAVLAAIAVAGVALTALGDSPPVDELEDCTPGFLDAPAFSELAATWTGSFTVEKVWDVEQPIAVAGPHLATRTGTVYTDREESWTEPDLLLEGPEVGLLDVAVFDGRVYTTVTRSDGTLEIRFRPVDNPNADDYEVMLELAQPEPLHNAGDMEVHDGHMFVSFGDGGPAYDPPATAQDVTSFYGSIIRIAPTETGYEIPADNPKINGEVVAHWAVGLRNPWRIHVDGDTLWLPDVGNNCYEEVNSMPATGVEEPWNFGWPAVEGTTRGKGPLPGSIVAPLFEYDHGCAIIGGPVYQGLFIFSDWCDGQFYGYDGEQIYDLGFNIPQPVSIAEVDGGLWVLTTGDGVYSVTW